MSRLLLILAVFLWGIWGCVKPCIAASATSQPTTSPAAGKVVGLDYYYNHQSRDGKQVGPIWENTGDDGYSQFSEIWKQNGATLARLEKAPTRQDLDRFSVYIIVSPCNEKTAASHHPNYIQADVIEAIVSWVHDGGLLLLFANSKENSDFVRLNDLASRFDLVFYPDQVSTIPDQIVIDGQQVRKRLLFPEVWLKDPDYMQLFNGVDPASICLDKS